MNLKFCCGPLFIKSLTWAVAIEGTLVLCGVYTGAIDRGPHDLMAFAFGLSQAVGLVIMSPVTLVLSRVLTEAQTKTIVWMGVFAIQSLLLALLIWRVLSSRDKSHKGRLGETR